MLVRVWAIPAGRHRPAPEVPRAAGTSPLYRKGCTAAASPAGGSRAAQAAWYPPPPTGPPTASIPHQVLLPVSVRLQVT